MYREALKQFDADKKAWVIRHKKPGSTPTDYTAVVRARPRKFEPPLFGGILGAGAAAAAGGGGGGAEADELLLDDTGRPVTTQSRCSIL